MRLTKKLVNLMFIGVCFIIFGATTSCSLSDHESLIAEEKIEPTSTPELGVLESGIFFETHVPRRVRIENIWQGHIAGNLTRICAGQLLPDYRISTSIEKEEIRLGALYVMTFLADGQVETNLSSTKEETGALKIQDATEEFLILESTGTEELPSRVYYYDLNANRLADSLDEPDTLPTTAPAYEAR